MLLEGKRGIVMISALQREQVRQILLEQVEVQKGNMIADCGAKGIISGQFYYGEGDSDMSDLAIGFYEILYRELLAGKKVLVAADRNGAKGKLVDLNLAGDTMNTGVYHGGTKERIEGKRRHCLANFWLIPMVHGRRSQKLHRDYMKQYCDDVVRMIASQSAYFSAFQDFPDFMVRHFIPREFSSDTIEAQLKFIDDRAKLIANSSKASELWDYFNRLKLVDKHIS
ncbi:hypothetical protein [Lapidilactobacillus luobeiensis]|uniref:hypothetical protein n=1 Tax=Lapidilactobacillus luobeiensis TaxID=2950371 RepID=UPI0021C395A5|nr:hypothetical protein [Lapidilactobacillus luobeiensis]